MATMTQKPKTSTKFREMAERLARDVARLRGDRNENTPKRQKEGACARIEANHLERVQRALEALADGRESLLIPPILARITSKAQLLDMLRTELDTSGGYYSIRDTGRFRDQSASAIALRAFMDGAKTAAERIADEGKATREKIIALENTVKFSPIPGFFPTPPEVVSHMLDSADLFDGCICLEPSAGKGDIADAIRNATGREVCCVEISYALREILKAKGHNVQPPANAEGSHDFLDYHFQVDRIIMNPPFENGQDMDHVRHAYKQLRPHGRLVSVMSAGAFYRQDRKATEFREWFQSVNGTHEELEDGAFKNAFRATGTKTHLVVIGKVEEETAGRTYDLFS